MGLQYPKESLYKIWIKLVQWFQRRGCLKMLKARRMLRTNDRQSQSHWYTISLPMSLWLRWAKNVGLKIMENFFDINFNICFGWSKEPSNWDDSFEYLNHMYWLKIWKVILNCILLFFYHEAYYFLDNNNSIAINPHVITKHSLGCPSRNQLIQCSSL